MAHYNATPAGYMFTDEKEYLQAYEDVLEKYKDERDRVQKKTFTKWINQHLLKVRKHVNDLYEDLRDGHNLISLLEVLSGESLPREKGRMRFHRLQNVQIALDYLKRRQVKLVNIRNDDITDGNPKLTLGLIWTIILHFQISEIHVCGESEDMTAKERLLMWSQQMTEGYVGVRCNNFTTSWRDGRLFNAIIHKYRPDLVDMGRVSAQTSRSNLEQAFGVAERLGVARLLDPEDVDVQSPDEKSVITYVSTLYDVFPKVPDGVDGINANDVDIKWVEYQNMVNYLSQWIKHNVGVMSDRAFPNNPVELKALYTQYLQFKENEIPLKETEKSKIKHLYKMLEVWMEFGRIQLPQGFHPNDVEKEWGKLIVAMLEREKSLRPEVDRLEMLQQIATRVQRDCVTGEDKLALARTALQSDAKRLESGVQFQNEAEVSGYLLECENHLRQQVVDIQILLDGKFHYSDRLVQRVSKLRDDLLGLRAECSSVYSQGRTLTTEQTKMMISDITQSLNSGFSSSNHNSSLTPALTPGGLGTPGSTFTSSFTPGLTPGLSPAMTSGGMQPGSVQAYMGGGGGGMDTGSLQHLKHMQIRKPLGKSSLVDPNMTEEEVNMNFVQDLINWVEEMQVQLDHGDWGSDLPSVETHLENHKSVHRAIEEFQMSLKEAKLSEIQMTQAQKLRYSEKLGKLENQYGKLLKCSWERQKNLESLHDFVSRATMELIWLNEKEEEEVAFDWSERNGKISKKREYHADLMRELDDKEKVIKSVQDNAENLLQENHPARLTIEAYRAAMQTQWSWILQLCSCVEQHLKDNAVYFEFFNDAKESMDYLKSLQGDIQRKYGCDRTSSIHKLEDHIQESMDEKEQLLQYRSTVAGLVGKANAIVQLKPRSPDTPVRSSIPVKAICDYRQIEITIYKDDECVLASNSHRAKWKVISPSGNEAMVPSVCFTVPPPNKESVDQASRIEQLYQNVLALWHHSHINMKSVVSWHYLMADVRAIRNWNVSSIKTMLPGEHQQVLSNLQSHFEDFLEDSEESEVFTVADCSQLEREVLVCKEYYEELLKSAEREEHEESVYNLYISEVRNFRMRLEAQEEHLIRQIRTPLDRDDLEQSVLRITEQEKKKAELDQLKEDLETMKEKCETFLRQAAASPSVPTLSSDLYVLIQNMSQVYSMSSIYLEKLKTVSLVVRHSQSAEALVKLYEAKLSEEDAVNSDLRSIDTVVSTLKQWRSEIDEQREVFHDLEDGLQKARGISDRMFKAHNERDFDLDWHKEKADQLEERWHNVHSQIDSRLRDLEGIGKSLKYYKDSYGSLNEWVGEMEAAQLKTQENQPEDSKALAELLNQQKVLVAEMEHKQSRIDECQKYSEQYSSGAKDYELQLMTYRAMVDSQHKSPLKRRRMQNSADAIAQEFMDLRTRYTAVVTSMTQYVKFASETLKRTEGEERCVDEEKKEHGDKVSKLLGWMSSVKPGQSKDGKASTEASSKPQVSMEEMVTKKEQIAEALRTTQLMLSKHSDKMTEEEKQEAKEQLKSLHQAFSDLSQQFSDQTPSTEQEFQTIEGVLKVGSAEVYSVFRSVQIGLIDHTTGLCLLEAQLITSGLVLPQFRMCLELDDAFHHNLIDEPTWKQLRELNEANQCILSPLFSSEPLPVIAAVREGAISERLAMKVIEIQLATGGLRVSYTGDVLTLERAFQFGLIPAPLYVKLLERQDTWKDLINPSTAEKVSLTQLVQRSVADEETGLRLLLVKKSHYGSIELTSGREISVLRAVHEGLIDRQTTLRLLGAQLFAGGIVDPKTGRKLTVEEALSEGLIDQGTATGILSQQAQNGGIVNPRNGKRLTVDEAVQCDLMSSSGALLVLEKQKGFMGLLWPHSGEILTVSTSLQHEIITNQLAFKLLSNRQNIAALYIPENSEVVDINSATQNGFIDTHTAEVLKTIEIPDVFPDVDELNERFSSWLMLRELQIGGSHRPTDDNEIDDENINTPSPIEAKQLFISYLMMNSYMDPKSGQRLLIFDGQLTKMAELLVGISVETSENQLQNTALGKATFGYISLKEDISEDSVMSFESNTEDFGYLHITEETDETMKDHHASDFFREDKSNLNKSDNNNVVKVLAQDGTEESASAIDCVNNTTQPESEISIYQKNTISINPIGIDVGNSDNQPKETFNGISATQTPPKPCSVNVTGMSLPSGVQVGKKMLAQDFTEELSGSDKNTRQHDSDTSVLSYGIYQKNASPSPVEIGLETSDIALYNQPKGESATQAMLESSTPTKSCSVIGKDMSLLAQCVKEEAYVAVHSEMNARQYDSKANVLSNSIYQQNRHGTSPSSFEIDVETSEIASDHQPQETVNGVSATQTILENSARPRLCLVNDTDMSLSSGAKDSKRAVAQGLTVEASVEISSNSTSLALIEINLETPEIASDNQPKETANGGSATQTILGSSTPRSCSVDSETTIRQPDSEASVSKKKKKKKKRTNNTSLVPFEIDVETSHISSDKPKETFNGGSATQTILKSGTPPRSCSVNDTDISLPSCVQDSKRVLVQGFTDKSSSSENYTRQSDSERSVLCDSIYQKNTNNTSSEPFAFNLKTSASDNQPKETFTFNEGSATQILLERSTHQRLCSVNDTDTSFPSAVQDSKRMPAENSKREEAHSFTDESSISIDSEKNTRQHASEMGVLPDRICQKNTMSTCPTPFKIDSETDVASDNQPKGNFNGGSATQTILKTSTLCSVKDTSLSLPSGAKDSPQRPKYPVTPGCETDNNTKSESSPLSTLLADTLDMTTEFPCTEEEAWDNEDERGFAIHLLRAQLEEGGILDIISGKRYDLDAALDKGLVDEETVLEVLALQLHKGEVLGDERSTVATLKEAVSKGSISSQIALQIMEQQSLLGGVYDSKSGCTISVNEALESGLIDDDLAQKILHSDPVHNTIIDPNRNCTHSISYSQSLGLIDNNKAENIRQRQTDKKVAVLVLDSPDEDVNGEEGQENRNRHAGEDLDAEGKREQNCDSQKSLLPSFTISHGPVCRQIISPILSDRVTGERVIHQPDTSSSLREAGASQAPTSPLSDIVPGSRNSIQNDMLSNRSNSLSLSDGGQAQAKEVRQTEEDGNSSLRRDTDLSCEAVGFTLGDGQLGAGYREIVGNQTVSPVQSDSGVSCSSHCDLLSDERKMENVLNAVQPPASQLVKESDQRIYSSSLRDLSSDVTSTMSGVVGVNVDKMVINSDGVSSFHTVPPQQPLVKSDRDIGGDIEPTSSQNRYSQSKPTGQKKTPVQLTNSSDLAIVSSVLSIETRCDNNDSYDIGDQEQLKTASTKVISSRITPDLTLTDKHLSNSNTNVKAKANDRVESSRGGDSKPSSGRQEDSSDGSLSQITDQADSPTLSKTSQTGQTGTDKRNSGVSDKLPDTSSSSASEMTPVHPLKATEPGMRSDIKQDEWGAVENHPQLMAANVQPDSSSNTSSTSEITSEHPVKCKEPGLGSDLTQDGNRQNQCIADENHTDLMTVDVQPDSMTHDSVPPPASAIYSALRSGLGELVRMRVQGEDVDELQKAETQAVEGIINLIQDNPQSHGRGSGDFGDETDAASGLMKSSSPDLLRDLLKQEALRSGKTSLEGGKPPHEETPPSDMTQIQSQLLQVLQSVSSSQDPAMLRDVIGALSSILGGAPDEDRPHNLEIIQEEGSSDEAEGAVADPMEGLDLYQSTEVETISDTGNAEAVQSKVRQQYSTQDYLECVGRLQDHADVLVEIRNDLSSPQGSLSNNMEELHSQLEESQLLETHLSTLASFLTRDLDIAKQLLKSANELIPTYIHQDLASAFRELQPAFADVCQMSAERNYVLTQAIDKGKVHLESTYQELLSTLDQLSGCIHDNSEITCNLGILNTYDVDTVKEMIQKNKDMETNVSGTKRHLEDTAFDIQYFISEHAQFLRPAQSRHLLKSLSATQRSFKEQMERVANQRRTLELHLEIRENESQQKCLVDKQKEFSDKLQELCDNLTNTENRLIGHQQQAKSVESVEDLQQVQKEHQALQKDVLTNGSALNEVISSTKKFLDENRSKLTPDQIAAIESKLEDAKSKAKLINQRAEESRKDLEKSVTTAIKEETKKEAAVEQLEESKNKIEGLLDWINNIGNEKGMGGDQTDHMGKQNGNMPLPSETSAKNILGEDDDPNGNNGNALQTTDNDTGRQATEKTPELDLDMQYDRVKARHQEILSQQKDLIMATQSAQALLDHQAHDLSSTEKDKLQMDIQELKGRYDASLTQAEQQMKQVIQVQEELKKFQGDCEEFEGWLQQAEGEVGELGAPAGALNILTEKLQRQKSFSEDVISHKGDLRFITISGQKVLDVAKACGRMDPEGKDAQLEVDTTGTCAAVKEKLDSAASRYKALHSQCNELGNNLKDVVDKYKKYEDSTAGLLKWLNNSEEEARRQQSEAIAADPQTLQKQLEDTKALQGQTTGHQTAMETLRKTADSLVTAEGDLLTNQDEIQETVDDIVERYDNVSKSVSDRNEKLQITLTRSLSVQDGLDEMMSWMEGVEKSVKEKGQVPLDSAVIGDVLSKEAALEQDISSRQSSISAMKAKVKKFVETADPAAAALLQSKMDTLSQRFSDTCDKHKQKVGQLEQLKDKVEEFEKTSDKVQQFVLKRSQALSETDGPGKNVNELSQLMQDTNTELAEHDKDVEMLQKLSKELSNMGPEGSMAQIQGKMDNLSNTFNAFKDTVKEKEEEVSSCQNQLGDFRDAAGALRTWLEETTEKVPVVQPTSSEQSLLKDLQRVNALMEEWTTKGSAIQDINSKGSALCSLISVLTSPAKTKMSHKSAVTNGGGPRNHAYLTNKELMVVQQNMSYINKGHESLGELLKDRAAELSGLVQKVTEAQKETDAMITWLKDMKKTAASWNSASTEKDDMKTQLEQQKAFEEDMKQKREQLQKLREKLLHLIENHPDSPEAAKWKQMLAQIDAAWADVSGSVEDRKQHLRESNRNLDVFQTTEPQLRQWLSEKEMMLSVLGPLSMDPNMLNTQRQQVQILLNEFDSRKPQYDQLNEAAAAILSTSGKQNPSSGGKVVKDQLAAVTQKWQGLTGQLGQRAGLIDQAVGKTGQFQDLLRSLSQSAASLETQLNSQQALSSQPDVVKKQLEEANTISGQLREERKRLKEAVTLCSELSALVTEDYLKTDLARQLEVVTKPFQQLEDKAGKRIQQLNSAFASSQQFHQTSKDFQGWMNETLQEQSKPQAISAQVETLRQSLKEHSALQKALSEHEEPYSTIVREGETLLQNTDGAEKVALQGQLAVLRSSWDDVKKSSAEHQDKLQGALQRAQKYHEHAEKLQSWVQESDVREGSVRLSVDPAELESSISQLKAIQKDVDKHRGLVEQLNTAADSLLEVANTDTEAVREEKAAIGQNVDRVTERVQNKRESLEKISQRLKEFNDTHKEAKGQLEGAKKQLVAYSSLGVQAYSNKNLTNMKAQQKNLDGVNIQVEHLKSLAQGLVADVPEADGVTDFLLQADSLEKEYGSLRKDVGKTCSTLEGKLQGIGQFQTNIREMFTRFADLDDELDSMVPVGRDLAILNEQQGGIKAFVEKLQELMADTARGGDRCKKMLETEASPDLLGLKRDLDVLSKQCGKLMDRAKGREEQVGSTLTRLDELYSKLQQFTNKLGGAEVKEESQGSVGMETDVINQQLEAFKVFQKEEVDPLKTQLQDINWLGQGLIQNAAKGTSTKGLEHDLEDGNTRWNTLNKKIAERSAQLHEALLHCGRFQDALESLLSWLTDTEQLVSNQKPPSAEFKVVKAQIQEQILLQRLLDDRRPTVELIKKEGGKVAELGAESVDKEKVGKEIECLGQRWDALLKKAENRHKQLKSILVVAQQFHETLEPLSEWLSATEKRLAKSEPIGTQTSKLEEQISQHKALEEEIMCHSKDLVQAVSLGQMLKPVSSVDDKELVQSKLDFTQASYIELQERCRRKAEMLQQALANAQLFGEDEVALMNWLNEVHTRLSEVSVKDYKTDVLEKQCAEQLALHEDIELRKQNVDQAISNGLELLKQTTGDEVVVIQGKLDGIKTRYAEINSMSGNVSKTLDQALTLASKLQHTHEDLSSWLKNVEAELTAFVAQEPVGEQLIQAQDRQKALLKEARDHKPQVDKLNEVSSSLLELVPWRAREGLDKLVTEDNDRYKAASDTIARHVEQINAAILKSQQFEQAADTLLAWLTEAERKMLSLGEIRLEQDQTTAQLQSQKGFSMDIMRHKDAVDEIVKTGEAIMNIKDEEEKQALKVKIQALLEKYGVVSQLNSERCLQLERAQSLASQFWETYEELWPWLQETRTSFSQLPLLAIEYEALRQQQEELRQMRELIAEHKPHIDKMNKTGPQLLELSPVEGIPIREKYTATDQLYAQLKADVKQRAATLDEAISKSTQFHDKIEPMLESLERIAERLRQPPSISVEVEKIREQITENKAMSVDLEKLQPSYDTLKQRGEEMIARSAGADKDISAKAVQDKLDQMVFTWNEIHALMEEREAKLLDVMDLADKFWCDHCALIVTIKDTQDLLREREEPGVDPSVVKQQQESLESFKEEIDGLQEELDVVRNLGAELMAACGEPDKPVIKKSIDEVNSAWETLNKAWKERVDRLDEAMQAAVQFQDGLQGMFDWVDIVEHKLDSMSPVGTDLDTVKQQIEELKEFKGEAYQLQMEMERLNHQAGLLLKKVTEEYDRCAIQEPMTELKMLWDNLDENIINRQHKLEGALLALGQFQHALDELLAWMSNTEELLNEQRKAAGDPKAIEIELAKHHVLQNDVLAHKTTVEAVNKAGTDLVESTSGEEASGLQSKLENLTQRWKNILEKTEQRRHQLDSALLQAQGFHGEIEDMQQWLKDTERQLLASKAVGGLPDTAREQLNAHLELCSTLEAKEELYQELMNKGQQLLTMSPSGQDSNTEQDLRNLQDKRESVQVKVAERKVKLEEALTLATEFHNSLQDFINWLTQAEQTLTMSSPASLILENIMFQIDEHKVFVTEVNSHREQIIELDKTGTHLKYFSQKQDVVLIKNLLISVQGRWEKVVQRSVERGRLLDDARKRAKQFHETWNKLTEWLDESEKALDSELEIANDPDKIKMQLAQHKEFQKALGSKHSVYDTTSRTGRALKDKTSLQDDNQKLDDMLSELRDKWDTVCGKSVERQNKLEEALLFSGQFTDALQALIDWLYRVEPQLAEDQPVHGDIDLVLNLIDSHKVFQKELGKRTGSVAALKRSAKDLIESSHEDSSWVKAQMQELSARWETVCARSVSKQTRLEQALCQAEEFHSTVHILLEWLAEAEQSLRFHGTLPDDEEALRALIEQHKEFMKKQEEKRVGLNKATSMGEAILTICHPDSITTIKHWNTIIKARFEEVQAWARQHQQRLAMALSDLLATQELLEGLLGWLQWAEATLNDKDKEVLPQEIDEVKALIAEHQTFMEEMTRKQPDVDTITKTHKRKAAGGSEPAIQSQIPVLEKGRGGRKRSPTQAMYPSASQPPIETKNPRVNLLVSKWQQVWLLALDRRRKLNDAMDRLEELKEFANFDFDVWRKRYMRWMNHKKSRVMDFFRRIDKDQDGKVTRQEFIEGILSSKFPTSRLEMSAVADIFDRDGDGYIDYYEFVAALHPNKEAYKPLTDADKIEDEVTRQVAKCKCPKRFQVEQIGANKYRFYLGNQFGLVHCLHDDEIIANRDSLNLTPHLHVAVLESCILFGDSQQLRLVRILRSTVMVRVGGGWMALDEFLVKNDPCRVHHHGSKMLRSESNSSITQSPIGWQQISHFLTLLHEPPSAKGRTNMELREKFILPEGTTQVMASFRYRGRRSRPSSRAASPNRSNSSHSCPAQHNNPALPSTPKTPQHITRNYDKPWLTNSKPSTPLKSSDSFESQGSSSESTPIQGSKLRLPGYLSGKGFQSGEEQGTLINAAVMKARGQAIGFESRRPGSRPGSKAGSRGSSRRGSDASDFDISDIASVCSDTSETVGDTSRATPRSSSRQQGGKPSKIPTPQRRSTPSKLAKTSKR
ncbi:LOW QUALITY PROTEIN: dystonin [Coregonus clupeaformis]|uniref:LOW QUALITY PROTEIN: dystonin n=1 Tax=Coregonus clupeaformis TaxID=59861 RepID=UPI001E1C7F68|nr:LOW QUALITY PROTEIN: dystonin [Coregonus clupeaformis]